MLAKKLDYFIQNVLKFTFYWFLLEDKWDHQNNTNIIAFKLIYINKGKVTSL